MLHKSLSREKWFSLSLAEQLANVGAEVGRAINWKVKEDEIKSHSAFLRAIELLDLTIEDKKNQKGHLKELCRLKELLGDYFSENPLYQQSAEQLNNYFYPFGYYAALKKDL